MGKLLTLWVEEEFEGRFLGAREKRGKVDSKRQRAEDGRRGSQREALEKEAKKRWDELSAEAGL